MAEMAVSLVLDQLLPLLREEAKLLGGIHKEFTDIKDELESIQAFLKDADKRVATAEGDNTTNEGVKTWVRQVREAAFRIEDVIDDYLIQVRQQPRDPGCVALLRKIVCSLKKLTPRHQIASEIQDIKSTICGIRERSERYGFQIQPSTEQGSSSFKGSKNAKWHDPRMAALYIDEAEVVGFQAPKNSLIGWLVKGRPERTVISVVGMGGQGKTTLAKKVFDSKKVAGHFECRVWITVSQSYYIEGLLRGMLNEFCKQKGDNPPLDIAKMDRGSLISELRKYLQHKRYVFVFDDVWNLHFWDEIENALIDNKNGSRIFITTRNMDVAMYCKKSSFIEVHELQPLSKEQSFELFNKKTFRFDFDGSCPKELIDISFEIAGKCKGLPLAIVAIGGLLSTKVKSALEWKRFSDNMTLELMKDSHLTGITKILGFSFDDLPFYLKLCLLYFGIYPEDYEVESTRLFRQWIAERFVKEERGNTLEEVAEGYLTELINRSLVQVSSVTIDGKTKSCCVHDLIRMMILEKCEDLCFCNHISDDAYSFSSGIVRRLSIATDSNDFTGCIKNSQVRSLFLFTKETKILDESFMSKILTKHMPLKVLDFQDSMLLSLHKFFESLMHLKYLSFKNSSIKQSQRKLPKSIGLLQNLETLDLRVRNCVYTIPKEIGKLKKLRHLQGYNMSLFKLKGVIGGMKSLQTLSDVRIDKGGIELIREMEKLRQLRKLGLVSVKSEHGSALSSLLNKMQHLEKLRVESEQISEYDYEVIDLNLIPFPPMLRTLRLNGRLEMFPEWIPQLPNLVELKLANSQLTDDPMKYLENMQSLLSLSIIHNAYKGGSLHFHDGGFQNLKELYIRQLHCLFSIIIDKGALHSLKNFMLTDTINLRTVPTGIQHLEKLEVFDVWSVPFLEVPTGGRTITKFTTKELERTCHPDLRRKKGGRQPE